METKLTNDELLVVRDALCKERKRKKGVAILWFDHLIAKIDERIRDQVKERNAA